MTERKGVITFHGNSLTLVGPSLKVGDAAPDFQALKNDLSPFSLAEVKGKIVVISVVPSLDTPVCDIQTRRFNQEAAIMGDNIAVLTISMDLPFAQARWCGAADAKNLTTLSDHREASFANAYGQLIKELRLLARAVFVISKDGKIAYMQQVPEITTEPDYEAALQAVKKLT